jgi:LysR family transcriptional regulator, benzoate and cis,cis-muconate-responsive activator of ben and cat genes
MRVPNTTVDMMAAVIALAQKENLDAAGKELGVSPSAVYKRIQAANRIFGTRLFANTNDGAVLTETGEVFYAHALKALENVLLAEEATIASREIQDRHLLVGHSTYLPARPLALLHDSNLTATLGTRLEHKPGLTLGLAEDVAKGTLHAGFGYLPITHPDLLVYPLAEEPVLVCMPSGHPLAAKAVVRPQDLDGEPIIAAGREIFPVLHQLVSEFFEDFGIKLNVIAEAFGPPEAVSMVENRVGICFLTAWNIQAKPSIVARPITPQTLTRKYGLFVREDNPHSALKSFVDLILHKTASWRKKKSGPIDGGKSD